VKDLNKIMNNISKKPSQFILDAFSITKKPYLLKGGQGITYRCGDIILKPIDSYGYSAIDESTAVADIINDLNNSKDFRIPKPIRATTGEWVFDNWVAWTVVEGKETKDQYKNKFQACDAFHHAISHLSKPTFIDKRNDPWAIADRVTWDEQKRDFDKRFLPYINPIFKLLKRLNPIQLSNQLIHGDVTGNLLLSKGLPPALIDFSFYWRPAAYAKAIMIIDAIAWQNADPVIVFLAGNGNNEKLLLKAALRRIVEQHEHVLAGYSSIKYAINSAHVNFEVLKKLNIIT